MDSKDTLFYYENEAKEVPIFGSQREISLAENIINVLPDSIGNVLDVGCGEGYLLFKIRKKYNSASLYGMDISKGRIKKTKEKVPKATLLRGDILSLPFPNNSFDVVVCSQLLEHISKYKKAIEELIRIGKKHVIITVPNELPIITVTCPKCKTKHNLDGHVNFFTDKKLKSLFIKRKDVKIKKIRKFHTIYTYNHLTLKFPVSVRLFLDRIPGLLYKRISFLKPNFIVVSLEKIFKEK